MISQKQTPILQTLAFGRIIHLLSSENNQASNDMQDYIMITCQGLY